MIQTVTAMSVRQNLGELLNEVRYRHDTVLITKAGKPIAALVDIELFNRICQMKDSFEQLSGELANAYKDVTPNVVAQEIAEAVAAVREK